MEAIAELIAGLKLGEAVTHLNLAVFPVVNGGGKPPDYLTLDEAMARKKVKITEVSAGGSVPELQFVNGDDRRVFLLDGEELVGAKQNRVLNLSILVAAGKTIVIPVSCVERGRWSYRSREFSSSPRTHHYEGKSLRIRQVTESMKSSGRRSSDQGEVWREIDFKLDQMSMESPTAAMADIYESAAAGLEEYVSAVQPAPGQLGALFAIDGKPVGLDVFDSPETLRKLLPKLIRSYALDALCRLRSRGGQKKKNPAASKRKAEAFLHSVARAEPSTFEGTGEGDDVRLTGQDMCGAALVSEGRVVHLSAFRTKPLTAEDAGQAE